MHRILTMWMRIKMSMDGDSLVSHGTTLLMIMDGMHLIMVIIRLNNITIILEMNGAGIVMVMPGTSEKMGINIMTMLMMDYSTFSLLMNRNGIYGTLNNYNGFLILVKKS